MYDHKISIYDIYIYMNSETINARLHIALNGMGTAHYDPRLAVVHFLSARNRREREPSVEIYSRRDFVKKLSVS